MKTMIMLLMIGQLLNPYCEVMTGTILNEAGDGHADWSSALNEMVVTGFKRKLKSGGYTHYTWSDEDCLYWNDDVDDKYYFDVPKNAILDE